MCETFNAVFIDLTKDLYKKPAVEKKIFFTTWFSICG